MNTKESIICAIALSKSKGIGPTLCKRIVDALGSAQESYRISMEELEKKVGIGKKLAYAIQASKERMEDAEKEYDQCKKEGIEGIPYESDLYPRRLKEIHAPPPILYVEGKDSLNPSHAIAIVGSRNASAYGRRWTKSFIDALQDYQPTIVSGLAHGIDSCAHERALETGIPTFAIMAGGLDQIYPREHVPLASRIAKQGLLISEYRLGEEPERHHFPARNRIIAGMADATIIVEAASKSGALITAHHANQENRCVFALPGNVDSLTSQGCNELIQSHQADAITSASSFLQLMGWEKKVQGKGALPKKEALRDSLTLDEENLMKLLTQYPAGLDFESIMQHMKKNFQETSLTLFHLSQKKILDPLPGNRYKVSP